MSTPERVLILLGSFILLFSAMVMTYDYMSGTVHAGGLVALAFFLVAAAARWAFGLSAHEAVDWLRALLRNFKN